MSLRSKEARKMFYQAYEDEMKETSTVQKDSLMAVMRDKPP